MSVFTKEAGKDSVRVPDRQVLSERRITAHAGARCSTCLSTLQQTEHSELCLMNLTTTFGQMDRYEFRKAADHSSLQ